MQMQMKDAISISIFSSLYTLLSKLFLKMHIPYIYIYNISVCPSIYISIYPAIFIQLFHYLSICLCIYQSIPLSIFLFAWSMLKRTNQTTKYEVINFTVCVGKKGALCSFVTNIFALLTCNAWVMAQFTEDVKSGLLKLEAASSDVFLLVY